MLVEGQAQVSMNLTDFTRTPVFRVVELIRREAARYGVSIHHSELVGMIPQGALIDTALWYLQLDELDSVLRKWMTLEMMTVKPQPVTSNGSTREKKRPTQSCESTEEAVIERCSGNRKLAAQLLKAL